MQKILIVDDEPYIRLLLHQTLEDLEDRGVTLLTADNGETALEIIDRERPELVFLDVMMPRMNGFDVCNTVKQRFGSGVHIVLLSVKGQVFDRQSGKDAGADCYMTKPFNPDEVFQIAETVLGL